MKKKNHISNLAVQSVEILMSIVFTIVFLFSTYFILEVIENKRENAWKNDRLEKIGEVVTEHLYMDVQTSTRDLNVKKEIVYRGSVTLEEGNKTLTLEVGHGYPDPFNDFPRKYLGKVKINVTGEGCTTTVVRTKYGKRIPILGFFWHQADRDTVEINVPVNHLTVEKLGNNCQG